MKTERIRQVLSHGLSGRDFIIHAKVTVDDFGRYGEPILRVTTANGREVTDERIIECARDAILTVLDQRAELTDQSPSGDEDDET